MGFTSFSVDDKNLLLGILLGQSETRASCLRDKDGWDTAVV